MRKYIFILAFLAFTIPTRVAFGQSPKGTIRGTVIDKVTQVTLPGANVLLMNVTPIVGTTTNEAGNFRLEGVAAGRVSLKISFLGYKEVILNNLVLNSGKELVISAEMEEMVMTTKEVEIVASMSKQNPINSMTSVSARGFTIDETQRYAGSRNDVARMATNFAGVTGASDARNDIVIRGNSPLGLLWRLEGVDIPNPNHYGSSTATGGPVCMLNNNLLAHSDFLTGAFPAEYGNAVSGVFDLRMRNGNNEKHEFLGQVGFNGFELGAEGPLNRENGSSYLVNARYSTLEVMEKMGADFGTGTGIPQYKDASLKINYPKTALGSFSLFALGGISDIKIWDSKKDTAAEKVDFYAGEGYDLTNGSRMVTAGLVHVVPLSKSSYLKSTVSGAFHQFLTTIDSLNPSDVSDKYQIYNNDLQQKYFSLQTQFNQRFSSRSNLKAGAHARFIWNDLTENVWFNEDGALRKTSDYTGHSALMQSFVQWQYKFSDDLTVNTGTHFLYYTFNSTWSAEPRFGLRWNVSRNKTISLAYGFHSQLNPINVYFRQSRLADGSYVRLNENLGLLRSHHLVAGYDWSVAENTRVKLEAYAQFLDKAGVNGNRPSYFSLLNEGANFGFWYPDTLKAQGSGRNVGLELTVERFLSKGLYYLATLSLYDSKYKGSDGVMRSTAFDGGYVVNALLGKEFEFWKSRADLRKSKNTLGFDIKYTLSGGQRYTPGMVVADQTIGGRTYRMEYDFDKAYSLKYKDYQRFDLKITWRRNGKRITQEWAIDIQNLFDQQNIYSEKLNKKTGERSYTYQMGLLVIPQYRIIF